jgi:hypothetical protein
MQFMLVDHAPCNVSDRPCNFFNHWHTNCNMAPCTGPGTTIHCYIKCIGFHLVTQPQAPATFEFVWHFWEHCTYIPEPSNMYFNTSAVTRSTCFKLQLSPCTFDRTGPEGSRHVGEVGPLSLILFLFIGT